MQNPINNTVFNTRDLAGYLEFLESEVVDEYNNELSEEETAIGSIDEIDQCVIGDLPSGEEYLEVKAFCEELEGYCEDYRYGATVICEDYFTEYSQELCEECGYISKDVPSWIEIDWEATAENVKTDYTAVEFDGQTYYVR